MVTLFHYFPIKASIKEVFNSISTPKGLDIWWSKTATGSPSIGETYKLHFGGDYNWEAVVSKFIPNKEFELAMTKSDSDWNNSKVGFELIEKSDFMDVHFYHTGWKKDNEHFQISNHC